MRVKTSIVLSEELLKTIEQQYRKQQKDLSDFIEEALWTFISKMMKSKQGDRDLKIINEQAKYLNEEATDALEYQVTL